MADIANVVHDLGERCHETARGQFALGKAARFQGHAKSIQDRSYGEKTPIETRAVGWRRPEVIGGEPCILEDFFVLAVAGFPTWAGSGLTLGAEARWNRGIVLIIVGMIAQ